MDSEHEFLGPHPFGRETLESLRLRLPDFIDGFPVPLAVFDRSMNYVAVSRTWIEAFHLQDAGLIGRNQYDVAPFLSEEYRAAHRAALNGEVVRSEGSEIVLPDGTALWERWTIHPILGQGGTDVAGIVLITEDITEATIAKRKLEASEQRLRRAMEVANLGLFDARNGTDDVYVSPTVYDLLGTDLALRTPEDWIALADSEDRPALRALQDRALDPDGTGRFRVDLSPEVRGVRRHFELKGRVDFDGEGEARRPVRTIGVLTDQTDQVMMAEALASAQRLETVGRMAGMIAHDFNNLLTVILSNLEFSISHAETNILRDHLNRALEATQLGASFTRRLLSLSGSREPRAEAVAVDAHLAKTWSMIERVLGEAAHTAFTPGAPLGAVYLDKGELDGAVLNLVLNAREATAGGGTIRISTGQTDLTEEDAARIGGARPGTFVWLAVTDTGTGMPPEVAEKAIEPFFTTKSPDRGNGLGLTSVATMLSRAGGFLHIASEEGAGTEVRLYLPRIDLPTNAAANTPGEMPMGDGELILVVEDDPLVRETVLDRLEALGYAVLEAGSVEQALSVIDAGEPVDLVFSDVVLPNGLSGFDLIARLRAQGRDIPALLTSGHISGQSTSAARVDTTIELLPKPYSLPSLAGAIARTLRAPRASSGGPG